jgi:hypothetical protein
MKPPRTLDHVALWYARGFAIFLCTSSVLSSSSIDHLAVIPSFFWLLSCFTIRFDMARLYLAVSGVVASLVIGSIGVQELQLNGPPYFANSLPLVWLLVSFAMFSWVGLRAHVRGGPLTAPPAPKKKEKLEKNGFSLLILFRHYLTPSTI